MTNYRLQLEYEGTDFSGWQRQPDRRTVQGVLERAIAETIAQPVTVQGCSRTDTGVHALAYVANFKADSHLPPERMMLAISSRLDPDVTVTACDLVPDAFDACSDALGKVYRYTTVHGPIRPVLSRRCVNYCHHPLRAEPMRRAARAYVGTHDFAAFANQLDPAKDTTRTIWAVSVTEAHPAITITVLGEGFMYNMVRIMAGTLIEVGRSVREPDWVAHVLASRDRTLAGPTAPAKGLSLVEVIYDPDRLAVLKTGLAPDGSGAHTP